jgi:hypothetical protein
VKPLATTFSGVIGRGSRHRIENAWRSSFFVVTGDGSFAKRGASPPGRIDQLFQAACSTLRRSYRRSQVITRSAHMEQQGLRAQSRAPNLAGMTQARDAASPARTSLGFDGRAASLKWTRGEFLALHANRELSTQVVTAPQAKW